MKRKDLKPGDWYMRREYNAQPYLVGPYIAGYVTSDDFEFASPPDEDVELCDPPEWFSEVWVRREKGGGDA